ncbi:PAS domain S-box protein [Candidatus Dojkabacteria bacterium]|nr:PAS domain S-box protein [Candidatus Dojkabacteria bacterium]
MIKILPNSFQFPELICVRIIYNGKEYKSDNFKETKHKLIQYLKIDSQELGAIEVYYLKNRGFIDEEKDMISEVGSQIVTIIEQKRTQQKLKDSEEKYRLLFNNSKDALMTLEPPDWKFTTSNPAIKKMFGIKSEKEFTFLNPWEISPKYQPDGQLSSTKAKKMIQKALKDGSNFFEWTHKKLDGENFYATVLLVRISSGKKKFLQATVRDITEEKHAKYLAKISELRYRRLFETAQDGILILDYKTGMILAANKFLMNLLGYSKKELLKKHFWEISSFKDIVPSKKKFASIRKKKSLHFEDLPLETKSGKKVEVEFVSTMYLVGESKRIHCNIRDITARRKSEREAQKLLRLSEEKFSKAFHTSPYVMTITEMKTGKFIEINEEFTKLTGYSREETLANSSIGLGVWSDKEDRELIAAKLLAGLPVNNQECQFKTKSGEERTGLYSAQLIELNQGLCILSSVTDITEREKTQRLIHDIKNRDEALLESIGDAVFATDVSGKILLFNKMAEKMTGKSATEVIGKHYKEAVTFISEDTGKPHEDFIVSAVDEDKITKMGSHVELIRKDGVKIPVADSAAPIKDMEGKIIGCVVVFHDVTQERLVDRAKTEFVSLASHQLRTPLSTINWYVEMLLSLDVGNLTPKQKQYSEQISKASRRMVDLVNALLNVSRLELGTFMIEPKRVNIKKTAQGCLNELKSKIVKKKLNVRQSYKGVSYIKADPQLLTIIFQNLLSNAIKYSNNNGRVGLTVKKEKSGILIKISDAGIGIPKHQQKGIFQKLFRADNAKTLDPDGTGLGLYIVKQITDYTGGEVWFRSIENKGTTFYIRLPLSGMTKKVGSKSLT